MWSLQFCSGMHHLKWHTLMCARYHIKLSHYVNSLQSRIMRSIWKHIFVNWSDLRLISPRMVQLMISFLRLRDNLLIPIRGIGMLFCKWSSRFIRFARSLLPIYLFPIWHSKVLAAYWNFFPPLACVKTLHAFLKLKSRCTICIPTVVSYWPLFRMRVFDFADEENHAHWMIVDIRWS